MAKDPFMANKLFWEGRLKPNLTNNVGTDFHTTDIIIGRENGHQEKNSFILHKEIDAYPTPVPAIDPGFLQRHFHDTDADMAFNDLETAPGINMKLIEEKCGQQGHGLSSEVLKAMENPVKVAFWPNFSFKIIHFFADRYATVSAVERGSRSGW